MRYQFYTADVFTDQIFGGNPLAVFPYAQGLNYQQMQQIAAEFNYSETVFVLPPETPQGTKRLRIFTPKTELPFAGHPTVGTAYILAKIGEIALENSETMIIFEEGVGLVPVTIRSQNGQPYYSELTAAQLPKYGTQTHSLADLATILSLEIDDFLTGEYSLQAISCGVPFLFIPVRNREVLGRIQLQKEAWNKLLAKAWAASMFVFADDPELEGSNLRARMFAPAMGIDEDPATGSAATALGGYLALRHPQREGTLSWIIEQGFEMGRPSLLKVETDLENGTIREIRVGGNSVLVSEGTMAIPD